MSYLTDRKRVAGLGVAKNGVEHWVSQRMTAVALIPLSLLFIFPFMGALGSGYDAVIATYTHPGNALVALMFFTVLFRHHRLGLQVVIEDYIHNHRRQVQLLILNTLVWRAAGFTALFAIAKIAFTAT
ncbi:MAG: succinate dehydrogenase, hydrophobic membrane anchor protein [Rhodobacterales bacterium]|nr:succinate dehydrogenase, hydrophobic membrane anchor protein [Rhodobacterales bacterium]